MWSQLLPGAPPDGWQRKPGPHARIDFTHPLASGLTGAWLFNEAAGGMAYDIASGNKFTASGTYGRGTGPFGRGSTQFNGGVQCSGTQGFQNAQLSVLCWVNLSATQLSKCFVDTWGNPGAVNRGWALGISDGSNNVVKWYTAQAGVSEDTIFSGTVLTNGQWYQVVGTFDGTTKRLFVNGKQEASDTWSHTITYTSTTSWFGSLATGSNQQQYNGLIDHCLVWNRALTAAEVLELYRRPFRFVRPPGPLALYAAAGGSGAGSLALLGVGV
jgi:hypothetical protein